MFAPRGTLFASLVPRR
ncbi:hypothetical protein E2C01_092369 [Portunus trituberculatus]|uniref:Uncharacterized protein n=1 Tax=Portunus trituberculatus TaxID=210409 RepID=A0A5B7JVL8_PORTR|nr:hypothetical protein [Portunus trituberculatus]